MHHYSSALYIKLNRASCLTHVGTEGSAPHRFFGVIDPAGFNMVQMSTTSGHWGADDFTVGIAPEPATLFLLGGGLLGIAVACRRRRNKA
jgi:hypothetical protein